MTYLSGVSCGLRDGRQLAGCFGLRKLGRQNVRLLDHRRFRKKIGSVLHQGLGDFAIQVVLSASLVGECVEDRARTIVEPNGEPSERPRLGLGRPMAEDPPEESLSPSGSQTLRFEGGHSECRAGQSSEPTS